MAVCSGKIFSILLISATMVMTMMVTNASAATVSECVVACMPICLKLKDSAEDACENGCTLGCQQLQGKGFRERHDQQNGNEDWLKWTIDVNKLLYNSCNVWTNKRFITEKKGGQAAICRKLLPCRNWFRDSYFQLKKKATWFLLNQHDCTILYSRGRSYLIVQSFLINNLWSFSLTTLWILRAARAFEFERCYLHRFVSLLSPIAALNLTVCLDN